jgi:asparagine synthase (glutamine-hydrolysing)
MAATLEHRGPDSDGFLVDGEVGLGARRLSIIDLEGGDQPIANEDGTVHVVQNGEIYNHQELRVELERAGHRFRTRCDTEVLVHSYEEWGDSFARRLRGMFAIAILDAPRQRVLLARDAFGIKPLYYRVDGDGCASRPSCARCRGAKSTTDALEAFLAFNSIPAPLTIFRESRKLPAGHVLVWAEGEARIERFARPAPVPADAVRDDDEAELVEECRARLRDSVRAHLVSDVPVGVLLSGGVDSGVLAALAAQESGEPLRTFSIGFEESSFDELGGARLVAQRYATDHHELVLRPDAALLLPRARGGVRRAVRRLVRAPDLSRVRARVAPREGRALGRGRRRALRRLLHVRGRPARAPLRAGRPRRRADRRAAPELEREGELRLPREALRARGAPPPLERHHGWKEIFSPELRAELTGRRNGFDPLDLYRSAYTETDGAELLARLQDVDRAVYLVDDLLVKTDRASMAHSLEARVPFCDPVVASFAHALPTRHKVRGLRKKVLLRKAAEPLLPRSIVSGKKRGFSIPAAAWLRGELEPFARATLSARH